MNEDGRLYVEGGYPQFAQVPAWIILHPDLKPHSVRAWAFIALHADMEEGSAFPGMDKIAAALGISRPKASPYVHALADVGALRIEVVSTPRGRRNDYYLRFQPPPAYEGPTTKKAFYAALHSSGGGDGSQNGTTPKMGQTSGGGSKNGTTGRSKKGTTGRSQNGTRTTTRGTTTRGTTGGGFSRATTSGSRGSGSDAADAADDTEIIDAEIVDDDTDGLFAETDVDDPAAEKEKKRNDAIEREMLQQRAKVVEQEHAAAAVAEQERNQPNRYPPVDYRGPQYGGTGWARTDTPPAPKAPQQRTDSKPKPKPEPGTDKIPFPTSFRLTSVMAQKAKAQFPELDPENQFRLFEIHARENNWTRRSWMGEWEKWLIRAEEFRAINEKNGQKRSYAPRGGMTNHEAKMARNHAVVESMRERREAGWKNPYLPDDHPNQPQPQRPALPASHKTNPFFQSTPQIPAEDQE